MTFKSIDVNFPNHSIRLHNHSRQIQNGGLPRLRKRRLSLLFRILAIGAYVSRALRRGLPLSPALPHRNRFEIISDFFTKSVQNLPDFQNVMEVAFAFYDVRSVDG